MRDNPARHQHFQQIKNDERRWHRSERAPPLPPPPLSSLQHPLKPLPRRFRLPLSPNSELIERRLIPSLYQCIIDLGSVKSSFCITYAQKAKEYKALGHSKLGNHRVLIFIAKRRVLSLSKMALQNYFLLANQRNQSRPLPRSMLPFIHS